MTINEVNERFKDEWVLLVVTAEERGQAVKGRVLGHSPSRKRISNVFAKEPRLSEGPGVKGRQYFIFRAHQWIETHEEWCAALDRVAQMDLEDIPRLW